MGALLLALLVALAITFSAPASAWAAGGYEPPPPYGPPTDYCPDKPGVQDSDKYCEKPDKPDKPKPDKPDKKPKKDKKDKKSKKGKKCKGGMKASSDRFLPGGPDVARGGGCGAYAHSPGEGTADGSMRHGAKAKNNQGKGAHVRPGKIDILR